MNILRDETNFFSITRFHNGQSELFIDSSKLALPDDALCITGNLYLLLRAGQKDFRANNNILSFTTRTLTEMCRDPDHCNLKSIESNKTIIEKLENYYKASIISSQTREQYWHR